MTGDDGLNGRAPRRGTGRLPWILGLLAGAWLLYIAVVSIAQAPDAEAMGYVVGYLGGAVLIALVIRFIYVRIRSADARPRFWSPWIIVIAAVVTFIGRIGNAL